MKLRFNARAVLRGIAVSTGMSLVLLLAAEGLCLAFGFGDVLLFRPHPDLLWEWVPDQDATHRVYGFPIRINRMGFRGPEIGVDGTTRIVALGGSCTFGAGVPFEETFPEQTRVLLAERYPDRAIEMINTGVSGYGAFQLLLSLEKKVLPLRPDLVIVAFSFNDAWQFFHQESDPEVKEQIRHGVWVRNLVKRSALGNFLYWKIGAIRQSLKKRGQQLRDWERKVELPQEEKGRMRRLYRQNLERIIALAGEHGIPLIFLVQTSRDQLQGPDDLFEDGQDTFRQVAREDGLMLLETLEAFRARSDEKLFWDEVHPTGEGHRITAGLLADAIPRRLSWPEHATDPIG